MSETDAVRPTGETGARCPICSAPGSIITRSMKDADGRVTGTRKQYIVGWTCKCLSWHDSPEAALAAANARPFPDFPAGAPGPWGIDPDGEDTKIYDANGDSIVDAHPGFLNKERSAIRDFILSRANAPARPAAAGLTPGELSQLELDRVVSAAAIPAPSYAPDRIVYVDDVRRAITEYRKILSSRATGAEVEMLNAQEMADIDAFASDKRIADPKLDPVEAIIEATVQWINARRGGGGVSDDSAMKQGRLEEMEKYSVAYYRGAVEGLYETERRLERALSISPASLSLRSWQFELCVADLEKARAENDALKQQLQALREPEYPDFAPGPWSESGGFIVDINDAPIFKIVSEEYHHKIAIRNFMDRLQGLKP